jgi:ATP-dependent DNA helicase DinG
MIAEIAKSLAGASGKPDQPAIAVLEAGTGTGKTVAYALAAIPVAKSLGMKIVISTATIALQEQIVNKDLPDLKAHSPLQFDFSLAKGRGRYLCLSKLDTLLQSHAVLDPNMALYEDEKATQLDDRALDLYNALAQDLINGRWDGDRDNWGESIEEELWRPITTDHRQCLNRRCSNFSGCSFFIARQGLEKADCIVANHDLVMADLTLGGGAILSKPEETIYIFDEGHHLPDKAISHFSHRARIKGTEAWLTQLNRTLKKIVKELGHPDSLTRKLVRLPELLSALEQGLSEVSIYLQDNIAFEATSTRDDQPADYRFNQGVVPLPLSQMADQLRLSFNRLFLLLEEFSDELKEAMGEGRAGISREGAESWFPLLGQLLARAEASHYLWRDYATASESVAGVPTARWLSQYNGNEFADIELSCSPILAAKTLNDNLWSRCAGAVVTSATLTALGCFDRLRMRTGLPENCCYRQVPSPFDYHSCGQLIIPRMSADPSDADAHTAAVIETLDRIIDPEEGSLVLFSSRKQMKQVLDGCREELRSITLAQGGYSKQELLKEHRSRIDQGQGSILFGLASFAEGVDLPGSYLTHVIIAKIPFAVPGHPVEEALSEWIQTQGGNPFMDISVPDASIRLVQGAGRLLRSETDRGRISLLDNRVLTRRYGKALLNALPPFQRVVES